MEGIELQLLQVEWIDSVESNGCSNIRLVCNAPGGWRCEGVAASGKAVALVGMTRVGQEQIETVFEIWISRETPFDIRNSDKRASLNLRFTMSEIVGNVEPFFGWSRTTTVKNRYKCNAT